jgi:hypothetical protein
LLYQSESSKWMRRKHEQQLVIIKSSNAVHCTTAVSL